MTGLAPHAPKLGKLIRLFGSDQDGEVLASVRAAERMLKGAGLDWHDLAEVIEREPKPVPTWPPPGRAPQMSWHEMALWCLDHDRGRLTERENDFIENVIDCLVRGA